MDWTPIVVGISLLAAILLLARLRAFRYLVRLLLFPVRLLARLVRGGGRSGQVATRARSVFVGTSGISIFLRLARGRTHTDDALGDVEDLVKLLKVKRRWGFGQIVDAREFYGLIDRVNDDLLTEYHEAAEEFLSSKIPIEVDAAALYDDIESATTIAHWKRADRRFFFLLEYMKRRINANVRWLAMLVTGLVLLSAGAMIVVANALRSGALGSDNLVGAWLIAWGEGADSFFIAVVAAAVMFIIFFNYYLIQRANFQEMKNFLASYSGQSLAQFQDLRIRAFSNISTAERDGQKLGARSGLVGVTLFWHAMRPLFIESFLRNILFQIRRNGGHYVTLIPLAASLFAILAGYVMFSSGGAPWLDLSYLISGKFLGSMAFLILPYSLLLFYSIASISEIDQDSYLGFDNWHVNDNLRAIFIAYGEKVALENARRT